MWCPYLSRLKLVISCSLSWVEVDFEVGAKRESILYLVCYRTYRITPT